MSKKLGPAPEAIKAARLAAGLTQTKAAALLYKTCRIFQMWEAGDRPMCPALWELFLIKSKAPAQ
ncbi:XRE family transcriptional regulator [Paraburkholderia sp. EG287A]|uniref:XRE family transcriptional regulator n=1 Tax=Paraburkholderia sp. EG287A TaxID=3237012 RepID=UPI0034D31E3C